MSKSVFFVLGMHRSGTSLLAKALETIGANLSDNLIPAAEDNPTGFFEDADVVKLNESILEALHLRWDIPSLLPEQVLTDSTMTPWIKQAASLLKQKTQKHKNTSLKDPRLSLLAPIWNAAAKLCNVTPHYVVSTRHPLDVAQSLLTRNTFEYQKGLDLWLSHNYRLTEFLTNDDSKRIVISYENLLADPEKQIKRLNTFVHGKTSEARNKAMESFATDFVDEQLAHSQTIGDEENSDQFAGFDLISELYQCLDTFANGRWSQEKASASLNKIDSNQLEAMFYQHQLQYFNNDIHSALGKQYHELQDSFKEEYAELRSQATEFRITSEQKDQYIQQLRQQFDNKLEILSNDDRDKQAIIEQKEQFIQEFRTEKELQTQELNAIAEQKDTYIQQLREQNKLLLQGRARIIRSLQRQAFDSERVNAKLKLELLKQEEQLTQKIRETEHHHRLQISEMEHHNRLQIKDLVNSYQSQQNDLVNSYQSQLNDLTLNYQQQKAQLEENLGSIQQQHQDTQAQEQHIKKLQEETDRHLQGALTRMEDIRQSLSYKAGLTITWPLRKPYDVLIEPFRKRPENLALIGTLASQVVKHPVQSAQLLRWEVMRNAYITFFKDPDIADNVVDHYVRMFDGAGADSSHQAEASLAATSTNTTATTADQIEADTASKVSVFVINYNGLRHLQDLLSSLRQQSYEDFEVIVVDNGSSDDSVEFIKAKFPEVRIVAIEENTGFAEANNIAAEVASGDYYCLLNNDTVVDEDWLTQLVNCIKQSPDIGAVGSKILFWKKFVRITVEISGQSTGSDVLLNQDLLESNAPVYRKTFFNTGWGIAEKIDNIQCQAFDTTAVLHFPICTGQSTVKLALFNTNTKPTSVSITTSVGTQNDTTLNPNEWTTISLDLAQFVDDENLYYLINNAGSHVDKAGNAQDRAFGVADNGQYDTAENVTALCGGAMLIRPDALKGKPVFGGEFFAYYEDTDLSLRIRENGYQLRYCPQSVVFHKHASTSKENSPFFRYYVNRNRILFLALNYPKKRWQHAEKESRSELNHLQTYYPQHSTDPDDLEFAQQIPQIFADWDRLLPLIEKGQFFNRQDRYPTLAVYNNFWHTLGGGEHHASVIAQALQAIGPVDLISENDFSIEELEQQFNLKLKHCRKRLLSATELHHNPKTTGAYDVFVNSTYSSNLYSHAKNSYYVVSFPYKIPAYPENKREFLASYTLFLANSQYTAAWVKEWWNVDNCEVLYPSIAEQPIAFKEIKKTTRILHVGRFFRSGHNKKQLELVRVFKKLVERGDIDDSWTLTLVGQVDETQSAYLNEVKEEAQGSQIEILTNVPLEQLKQLYLESAIYWHATGLGENNQRHPERNEHFGISTVEAMSYACVPIVINAGGQPETVKHEKNGFLFKDKQELQHYTKHCVALYKDKTAYRELSKNAYQSTARYSRTETRKTMLHLISNIVFQWLSNSRLL